MKSKKQTLLTAAILGLSLLYAARSAVVTINGQNPGPSPFISLLNLTVSDAAALSHIDFKIYPKPGSGTRPVYARYSKTYLQGRGLLNPGTGQISLPVFGLYANYNNRVALVSTFVDQTFQRDTVNVPTPVWNDPANAYKNPTVVQARTANTNLSYDFALLRNFATANTPVIIDTDGEVRWAGTAGTASQSAIFFQNGIYVYSGTSLVRQEFDGTFSTLANYSGSQGISGFHHNFDYGKTGILMDSETATQVESVILEVDGVGSVVKRWDLANIISSAMIAGGDDPSGFVKSRGQAGDDWFHLNASTYRRSDNTVLASSRESFVIAFDYNTGAIKWILGDSSKQWYQYPSLKSYALNLGPNTVAPIGQHAVSVYRDRLLLFDDGANSINHTPPGNSRNFSVTRKYLIDAPGTTATEIWNYSPNPTLYAGFCSSIYEDGSRNYLVDYATITALVGLDAAGNKVFDYRYPTLAFCGTIYNAIPIHLENLRFN